MSKKRNRENEAAFAAVGQSLKDFKGLGQAMKVKPRKFKLISWNWFETGIYAALGVITAVILIAGTHWLPANPVVSPKPVSAIPYHR